MHALPDAERSWLVYEFWSRAVSESGVDVRVLELEGWRTQSSHDDFLVWRPPDTEIGERAEFEATLLGSMPRTIQVEAEQSLADESLFGSLASTRRGGSSALMALSGAAPGVPTVLLRNPAALELDVITADDSLSALVDKGVLAVSAVGGDSTTSAERLELDDFSDPDVAKRSWLEGDRAEGFWLLLQVEALVDPPVGIPPGHIFEQRAINGVQTLAAASSQSFVVNPGPPLTVLVPAWCLNQNLNSPGGQRVSPVPLSARYADGTSQSAVWNDRQRVLST